VVDAMQRRYRQSLSVAPDDREALLELVKAVRRRQAAGNDLLTAIRDAVRERVQYVDDPRGVDSVQSVAASLRRGAGDCVSLTIAVSALARTLNPAATVVWRIGGDRADPSRHIWPVIGGVPVDAADPMPPLGREIHFELTREVRP
jgi:transglutaminase-like putative cysteine protease